MNGGEERDVHGGDKQVMNGGKERDVHDGTSKS